MFRQMAGINYAQVDHFQQITSNPNAQLAIAIKHGYSAQVKELLKADHIEINLIDLNGESPLILAIKYFTRQQARIEIFEMIVNHPRIDVNLKNQQGQTPLIIAIINNKIAAFKALLNYPGINLDIKNQTGKSALYYAVKKNSILMTEELLKSKIDVNQIFANEGTVLEIAIKKNSTEITDLLLLREDINLKLTTVTPLPSSPMMAICAIISNVSHNTASITDELANRNIDMTTIVTVGYDQSRMTVKDRVIKALDMQFYRYARIEHPDIVYAINNLLVLDPKHDFIAAIIAANQGKLWETLAVIKQYADIIPAFDILTVQQLTSQLNDQLVEHGIDQAFKSMNLTTYNLAQPPVSTKQKIVMSLKCLITQHLMITEPNSLTPAQHAEVFNCALNNIILNQNSIFNIAFISLCKNSIDNKNLLDSLFNNFALRDAIKSFQPILNSQEQIAKINDFIHKFTDDVSDNHEYINDIEQSFDAEMIGCCILV